jgi:hypothetical protein
MEPAALLLLILLPPQDATGNLAVGIKTSLHGELGEVAMAVVPDSLVTPAMWQGENAHMRARFVARVVWEQEDRARVELLAFPGRAAGTEAPHLRRLAFTQRDSDSERGRTLGLVIAEMMREAPSSAWIDSARATTPVMAPAVSSHLALGAMFTAQHVASGMWALGPGATYAYAFGKAIWLQGTAAALLASSYNYIQVVLGVGASWRFLRWDDGRHAIGVGLRLDLMRESVSVASENGSPAPEWNVAIVSNLRAHATVWRSLRVVAQADLGVMPSSMSFTYGGDASRASAAFSRWRPALSVGLESGF